MHEELQRGDAARLCALRAAQADRFYAMRDAVTEGLCNAHAIYSTRWHSCVREAADRDLRREPLPSHSQRCDPSRPPEASAEGGVRHGCPLATAPFAHSVDAYSSREFLRRLTTAGTTRRHPVVRVSNYTRRGLTASASALNAQMCSIEQRGCPADRAAKPPTPATIALLDGEVVPPEAPAIVAANRAAAKSVFIVGASRGVGLALAKVYMASGYKVLATTRTPHAPGELGKLAGVTLHELDVQRPEHIAALRAQARSGTLPSVGTLVYSAGIKGSNLTQVMHVNTHAPFAIFDALLPALLRAPPGERRLSLITSDRGSATLNRKLSRKRQRYPYTVSKQAATARFVKEEPAWRAQGVTALVMSPGYVKTAINGGWGDLTPVESALSIMRVLEGARLVADAGKFLDYDGTTIPW